MSSTSYGAPDGLFGINCGHKPPNVFVAGLSVIREEPKESKAENDRRYEESQKQRRLEREVRKTKREAVMLKNEGDVEGFKQASVQVHSKQHNLQAYCKSSGLTYRVDRAQVVGFDRSVSRQTTVKANEYYNAWAKSIGVQGGVPSLKDYYDMKLNRPQEYERLRGYVKAVRIGDISPFNGFDKYMEIAREIESKLVGVEVNGMRITGFTNHFIDHIIGETDTSAKGKRLGVPVDEALDALMNPIKFKEIVADEEGRRSFKVIGEKCRLSISPDTNDLLETFPRSEQNGKSLNMQK